MGQKVRRAAKTALSRSPIDSESTGSPMKNGKSSLYEALKRRILTLELAPDQDLDEVELSEEYGISRTPMRDVLRRWREKDTLERGRFALLGSPTSSWTQSNAPMGYRMAGGIRWDDFEEALAAVRDVGPGGHYLGHPHTPANFQRAFFMPKLFDNNSFELWSADGSKDTPSALSTKPARSVRRMRSRSSTNASTKRRAISSRAAGARFPPSMR